jgi:hypothetical protein
VRAAHRGCQLSISPSKIGLPAILLANDLLDGEVVFWAHSGWSTDPSDALVAHDTQSAELLSAAGQAALARQEVVDAYLVDVTLRADGMPIPNHFRERFKISGPSIRRDLGKQAQFKHIEG